MNNLCRWDKKPIEEHKYEGGEFYACLIGMANGFSRYSYVRCFEPMFNLEYLEYKYESR